MSSVPGTACPPFSIDPSPNLQTVTFTSRPAKQPSMTGIQLKIHFLLLVALVKCFISFFIYFIYHLMSLGSTGDQQTIKA